MSITTSGPSTCAITPWNSGPGWMPADEATRTARRNASSSSGGCEASFHSASKRRAWCSPRCSCSASITSRFSARLRQRSSSLTHSATYTAAQAATAKPAPRASNGAACEAAVSTDAARYASARNRVEPRRVRTCSPVSMPNAASSAAARANSAAGWTPPNAAESAGTAGSAAAASTSNAYGSNGLKRRIGNDKLRGNGRSFAGPAGRNAPANSAIGENRWRRSPEPFSFGTICPMQPRSRDAVL